MTDCFREEVGRLRCLLASSIATQAVDTCLSGSFCCGGLMMMAMTMVDGLRHIP